MPEFPPVTAGADGPPLVGIVVVDFNGLDDTMACVESLLAQDHRPYRLVVVDNGSTVDEAATVQAAFGDRVATIRRPDNGGYGAAANTGIRWALERGAAFVWLLNNDTRIEADSLVELVAAMTSDPRIGIASPQIRAPAGPEAPAGIWYAGGTVDLAAGATEHLREPLSDDLGPIDTAFITGTAPILRRELIEDVGLFWEHLFLFWEDTDLCLRAQRAGWRTCVVPRAWIFHRVHGSMSSSVIARYHYRNALLVVQRHGTRRQLASAAANLGRLMLRLWAAALLRRRPRPVAASLGYLSGLVALLPNGRSR